MNLLYLDILKENCDHLNMSIAALQSSFNTCSAYCFDAEVTDEQFVHLEAMASRFARTVDILTKQVFRTLDLIEYGESGTLIDIFNHCEKRKIINQDHKLSLMKQLRNQIAHEYIVEAQKKIYVVVIDYCPDLIQYCRSALSYSQRYL